MAGSGKQYAWDLRREEVLKQIMEAQVDRVNWHDVEAQFHTRIHPEGVPDNLKLVTLKNKWSALKRLYKKNGWELRTGNVNAAADDPVSVGRAPLKNEQQTIDSGGSTDDDQAKSNMERKNGPSLQSFESQRKRRRSDTGESQASVLLRPTRSSAIGRSYYDAVGRLEKMLTSAESIVEAAEILRVEDQWKTFVALSSDKLRGMYLAKKGIQVPIAEDDVEEEPEEEENDERVEMLRGHV